MSDNYFSNKFSKSAEHALQNISSCSPVLLDVNDIDENPKNSRLFNMGGVDELAAYMDEVGVHESILVFQKEDGRYEILSGHRKFRARKKRGDAKIDAIIQKAPKTEGDRVYQLIFDNINARILGPMDLARAMDEIKNTWLPEQRAKGLKGDTKKILAEKFHISETKVMRLLRLLTLIPELQNKVEEEKIAVDAALVLTQENNKIDGLQEYVNKMIDEQLSSTEDKELIITKMQIVKFVNSFKQLRKAKKSQDDSKPITTKKNLIKAVASFNKVLNNPLEENITFSDEELQNLKKLQSNISEILLRFS